MAWKSPIGTQNSAALRELHPGAFDAIAELDRLGHMLLDRVTGGESAEGIDWLVGAALLRRAVANFAGLRALAEASSIDPAKAIARAHFELWLHYKCFVYGDEKYPSPTTPIDRAERKIRASRYYVAAQRRGLRSRALVLAPDSKYPPKAAEARALLERELHEEYVRLRTEFRAEWKFFGDVALERIIKHVGGRDEPPWYSGSFANTKIRNIRDLAHYYEMHWEYDFVYDALSSQLHPRGLSGDLTLGSNDVAIHHPANPDWFTFIAFWTTAWHQMLLIAAARVLVPAAVAELLAFDVNHGASLRGLDIDTSVWKLY